MNFSQLIDKGVGKLNSWKGAEPFCPHLLFCLLLLGFPCAILKMLIMSLWKKWCFDLFVGFFFSITIKKKYSKFSCLNMCVHAAAQQMQLARSHFLYYDPSWKVQDEKLSSLCQILLLEVAVAAALCQNWSQAMFCKHRVVLSRPHSRRLTQFEWGEWRLDNRCSVSMGFVQPLIIEVQEWNV